MASGGHSSSRCTGLPPSRPLPLQSTGSRRARPATVAHGPSRSAARGILPDEGSNPCPLHWQADSQPLRHQGSPPTYFFIDFGKLLFGHKMIDSWNTRIGNGLRCIQLLYIQCSLFYRQSNFIPESISN